MTMEDCKAEAWSRDSHNKLILLYIYIYIHPYPLVGESITKQGIVL